MAKTKSKSANTAPSPDTPDDEVAVCRRRNERREEPREEPTDLSAASERRKVPRRRQIDPTTCERDYTADEIEFMHALDAYKRSSGRMFPTCSEILEVVRDLGYAKSTLDEELSEDLEVEAGDEVVNGVADQPV